MGSGRNETTEYREILDLRNKNISHILKLKNTGFWGKTSITGLKKQTKKLQLLYNLEFGYRFQSCTT